MRSDSQLMFKVADLTLHFMNGTLDEAGLRRFEELLANDPVAVEYYLEVVWTYIGLNSMEGIFCFQEANKTYDHDLWRALLNEEKSAPNIDIPSVKDENELIQKAVYDKKVRRLNKMSLYSGILSAAALFVIALLINFGPVNTRSPIAILSRSADARWLDSSGRIGDQCDLYAGPLHLVKGCVEIHTDNGTKIILEGPAELELESASQMLLRKGKVTVNVQPGDNHYVVRTPTASVIDFGTEFGVCVDEKNKTRTYVYEGQVELRSGSNPLKTGSIMKLVKGQGAEADAEGWLNTNDGISNLFVRSEEFEARYLSSKGSDYQRWLAYSYQLRRDPAIVAYYTFEEDSDRRGIVNNMAGNTSGSLDGVLSSAISSGGQPVWTSGRWPQKTALQFDRSQGQYVKTTADSQFCLDGSITIMAWIYCFGPKDGGHIVSNRVPPRSTCNYQVGYRSPISSQWSHSIHLARKKGTDDAENQHCSGPIPDVSGWQMIVVTHDNQTVKFYYNGHLIDSQTWKYHQQSVPADLLIGTDSLSDDASRFNGKIGEIAILKRILTDDDIMQMWQASKP